MSCTRQKLDEVIAEIGGDTHDWDTIKAVAAKVELLPTTVAKVLHGPEYQLYMYEEVAETRAREHFFGMDK